MSYENIIEAINTINASIVGIRNTFKYEPSTPPTPCLYTILGSIPTMNQLTNQEEIVYDVLMRLLLQYTHAEKAEIDATKFVDRIIEKYRTAIKLNGALSNGNARLIGGRSGYIAVGSVIYRMIEFTLRVTERQAVTYSE